MKIKSFVTTNQELIPIEVELRLLPGLPAINIIGLPDQQIKESTLRIKSAIKLQGFEFPKARQILVDLKPHNLKKSSEGLELAIAIAYLSETKQIDLSECSMSDLYVYGELSLTGEVIRPEFLKVNLNGKSLRLITGKKMVGKQNHVQTSSYSNGIKEVLEIENLANLKGKIDFSQNNYHFYFQRPEFNLRVNWSTEDAFLINLISFGHHASLFAGQKGSGKTTLVGEIYKFLESPSAEEEVDEKTNWRPMVKPHHSTPLMAMIGGSDQFFQGEITRAHGGVLILDELLEFKSEVLEALREPMEEQKIQIVRRGRQKVFQSKSLILGTTNLCPCGKWTPEKSDLNCQYSYRRCSSYRERLSGPFLDRFQLLIFSEGRKNFIHKQSTVSSEEILRRNKLASHIKKKRNQRVANAYLDENALLNQIKFSQNLIHDNFQSYRRYLSTLRVSRTIADLSGHEFIELQDFNKAFELANVNFNRIHG